jgi:protein TonB
MEMPMLSQLIESRPVRRRSPGGFAASVVVHSLIVAGIVAATAEAHVKPKDPVQFIQPIYSAPKPVPVVPPKAAPAPAAPTQVAVPNVVSVPIEVPTSIPPIDLTRPMLDPAAATVFVTGGTTSVGHTGIEPTAPGAAFTTDQVEIPVTIARGSPVPRFPEMMRSAGVDGSVRVRFVVDTLGRVEMSSVEQLEASHPAFATAVLSTLPRMRFTPARVGDHRVRQMVELPMVFHVDRE